MRLMEECRNSWVSERRGGGGAQSAAGAGAVPGSCNEIKRH